MLSLWKSLLKTIFTTIWISVLLDYVKMISGRFKPGTREESMRKIADYYNDQVGKVKGLKGTMLLAGSDDSQRVANLIFWETKEDMDKFYTTDKNYQSFLEQFMPVQEGELQRGDYTIFT
jgi:heme-degrading monooxygenase HmoA